jgi:hypothetical protein
VREVIEYTVQQRCRKPFEMLLYPKGAACHKRHVLSAGARIVAGAADVAVEVEGEIEIVGENAGAVEGEVRSGVEDAVEESVEGADQNPTRAGW